MNFIQPILIDEIHSMNTRNEQLQSLAKLKILPIYQGISLKYLLINKFHSMFIS
jgi:hypothetical protein